MDNNITSDAIDDSAISRRRLNILLVLGLLTSMVNFLDRSVLNILAEPIKRELHLTDTQLGLLTGLSFALFYSIMGIPIAYYIDKPHTRRPTVIALCLAMWSVMTMASGLVISFTQLLFARVLVAVGESGSGPGLTTLMDETVPRPKRARAFAIYSLGVPFGTLCGLLLGGFLVERLGWRNTFLVVGAPGIVLAVAVQFMLFEPRTLISKTKAAPQARSTLTENARILWRSQTMRWLTAAAAVQGLFGVGMASWNGVYLIRVLHLQPSRAGLILGLTAGIAGGLGTYFGGMLADRVGAEKPARALLVPAGGLLMGVPAALIALLSHNWIVFAGVYWIAALGAAVYIGPLLSLLQLQVPANYRAKAVVIVFMLLNLVGGGLGALAIGWVSDALKPQFGLDSLRWAMIGAQMLAIVAAYFYYRATRGEAKPSSPGA